MNEGAALNEAAGAEPRVGLLPTLGLMYATACGGPYGTEDFVPKVGPGVFLLLLFVTPWLCGVPTALATAELSTRRSIAGGYYRAVEAAAQHEDDEDVAAVPGRPERQLRPAGRRERHQAGRAGDAGEPEHRPPRRPAGTACF